jgi:hypothetical protein
MLFPVETTPDGPETARPYVNERGYCHHEAGHAVMAWHYGIRIQYIDMTPSPETGHGGQTALDDIEDLDIEMRVAAAGEIAQGKINSLAVDTDNQLATKFVRAALALEGKQFHWVSEDDLRFAKAALAKDADHLDTAGPAGAVRVWREAEALIRGKLWPAVEAVADELMRNTGKVGNDQVAELAAAALAG